MLSNQANPTATPSRRQPRTNAFTLIELLVVVSVISTLFSILIPSLKSAREKARIVVCAANTAGIAKAAATYATDVGGWLAGSPGTSGSIMYSQDPPDHDDENIATDPAQNWDYAGALAPTYMTASLPANRAERMLQVKTGLFACPSNPYMADPYPHPVGGFAPQPLTSYNTIRNFLLWPRTMVDFDPSRPWGPIAPVLEASFDTLGGRTLTPRNYRPHIDRITNPAGKAFLADGNRLTDMDPSGNITVTYDVTWDAEAGGAFSNGGPTLVETGTNPPPYLVLSSYHYDKHLGKYGYRHRASAGRGIVVNYFDGHSTFVTEAQSRDPDAWWPKGTVIPFADLNLPTLERIVHRLDAAFKYRVGR